MRMSVILRSLGREKVEIACSTWPSWGSSGVCATICSFAVLERNAERLSAERRTTGLPDALHRCCIESTSSLLAVEKTISDIDLHGATLAPFVDRVAKGCPHLFASPPAPLPR